MIAHSSTLIDRDRQVSENMKISTSHTTSESSTQKQELLEKLGGISELKSIMTEFYTRVFRDPMIGYLFQRQNIAHLIERETEWTARLLGASHLKYQGLSLREAHAKHPIRRGHFHRRNQILFEVLKHRNVAEDVIDYWMDHNQKMIGSILGTAQDATNCDKVSVTSQAMSNHGIILVQPGSNHES